MKYVIGKREWRVARFVQTWRGVPPRFALPPFSFEESYPNMEAVFL